MEARPTYKVGLAAAAAAAATLAGMVSPVRSAPQRQILQMVPMEPQHEGQAMGRRSGCRRHSAPSFALVRARWLAQCQSEEAEEAEEQGRQAHEAEERHWETRMAHWTATGLAPVPQWNPRAQRR